MLIVARDSATIEAEAQALQTALSETTGLALEIVVVERAADALDALCASPQGVVSVAWLDGLTALAAEAQGCGDLTLATERVSEDETTVSHTIQIVTSRAADNLAELEGRTFCRVSAADFETWLYPGILLKANGLDVVRDASRIEDHTDAAAVASAVAERDCDAAGISAATFAALDEDTQSELTLLEPTLSVPYGVLVYPQEANLSIRTAIDNAFTVIADNEEQAGLLESALLADGVRPVTDADFDSLRDALRAAELDLALIGR